MRSKIRNITATLNQIILWQLSQHGYVEKRDGGSTIITPLFPEFSSGAGFEVLDIAQNIAGTISSPVTEMCANSESPTQILYLVKAKVQNLALRLNP